MIAEPDHRRRRRGRCKQGALPETNRLDQHHRRRRFHVGTRTCGIGYQLLRLMLLLLLLIGPIVDDADTESVLRVVVTSFRDVPYEGRPLKDNAVQKCPFGLVLTPGKGGS